MKRYRVRAFYDRVPVERSAEVWADSPERAMVAALLTRAIPAGFAPDEHGWLGPVWWSPRLARETRWPRVAGPGRLQWGAPGQEVELRCQVDEIESG